MKSTQAKPKLIVGVGASAGGLEAFRQLLSALPPDGGMAFVLVQHLDPSARSVLPDLLASRTKMAVVQADDGVALEPNTVYVIRPNTSVAVHEGALRVAAPALPAGARRPVDHLFRSLAHEQGRRAVGIVLSGAGSDGAAGMREIKSGGGLTLAQDPDTCGQRGMPQSAIDAGAVDMVLPIADMPAALGRFARLPPDAQPFPAEVTSNAADDARSRLDDDVLDRLSAVLAQHTDFDLRAYKPPTVGRRVLRRMALSGLDDPRRYCEQLAGDPVEQQMLVRDLLIGVTEFFRSTEAFVALRERVLDPLVTRATPGSTLRLWVPGCATGEEAYSLGIEMLDAIDRHRKRVGVQIFATDADAEALALARAGVYPPSTAARMSEERLRAYFKPIEGRGFQVRPVLRDLVSFAAHDLTKDPPFSRIDLVSCRNVLIYLTAEAQARVLRTLHFALQPDGHLFLSGSESTGSQRDLFATVSKTHRIYRKVGASRSSFVRGSRDHASLRREIKQPETPAPGRSRSQRSGPGDLARQVVLAALVPPTVVVSGDGLLLFSHGDLGPYLQIPEGDAPRLELSAMLRPEIATRARAALHKCRRRGETVTASFSPHPGTAVTRISARPAPSLGDEAVILTFEPLQEQQASAAAGGPADAAQDTVVEQLERELHATREDLQSTVEELEASNEELRASNEEAMSTNEELQSTNEELEATTEELRSLNEELTTVNTQLREKVEEVEQAHDDLHNFFSSTKVATVFLDEDLRIKRFTPASQELLGIGQADTGRCVSDIARDMLQNELVDEAKAVLDRLTATSRELRTREGRWMSRSVLPYRTESRRIEGVVVTFTDVTELRRANEELNEKSRRLEMAWEAARGGVLEHRVPVDETTFVSDQWAQVLGYRRDELPAHDQLLQWIAEQAHPEDREAFERAYVDLLEGRTERHSIELRLRHRGGHWIWVRKIAKILERDASGRVRHVLRMMIDITDLKQVEASLKESETRFREMADGLPLMVWMHDESGHQEMVNQTFHEFFGVSKEQTRGGRWQMLVHPDDTDAYMREFYACIEEKRPFHAEARVKHADGRWRWIESWGRPRYSDAGQFRGFVGTSVDVTDRRRIAEVLRESEERFRTLADNISQLAWMAHGDGWIFWYNKRWFEYTGSNLDEMAGWGWRLAHHPEHVERVVDKISRCFETGQPWEDTFPLRGADGKYRWFLSRAIPIRDDEGHVVRWFGTNTDVTQLRDIEEKLVQADRQKDEFLAMLGHELRNPLAAIRMACELLAVRPDSAGIERTRQVLERQTGHMARLLDGLLDISRIIRGKISLHTEVLDFRPVCREAVEDLLETTDKRELEVRSDLPSEPLWVAADKVRLAQIVGNLLSNAVKYTPDGGTIMLLLQRDDDIAVLRVRDTGVGIDPDLLPHVFEIFRQSEQSLDRAQGGLGLGLALVKTLVELQGGSVEARSEGKGQGAEIEVRLPVSRAAASRPPKAEPTHSAPLRVLLIEDNLDAAEMLGEVLTLAGHQVTKAHQGSEGTALAQKHRPDVVLCDLGLPEGMSGFDVARALRADDATRDIPLIAISGYGRPEDRERSAEAGFDAHLTKPVDASALKRVLAGIAPLSRE